LRGWSVDPTISHSVLKKGYAKALMTPTTDLQIIAHRGFSAKAPENTLAALAAAIQAGADAVEFDVQTAACGTPVLFHDPMLGRTTNGVGPLRRRPLGHLKALDAGSWFSPDFAGQSIPTQEEALSLLSGRVSRVYQDIKGYREMEDLDRMVSITRNSGLAEATIFVSSDWVILNRLKQSAPEIQRAYLAGDAEAFPEALDRAVVDEGSLMSVEINLALEHSLGIQEALSSGVELVTWTVNDPDVAQNALQAGMRRITTDEVEVLLAWKNSLG
jgi:glycerophosphoryl diester phosphodiesterase